MIREFIIYIYLITFKLIFRIFNILDAKNKTTFVVSFGGNVQATLNAHESLLKEHEVVILQSPNCNIDFSQKNRTILDFTPKNLSQFIQSIYHLATSSHVIIDNYYAFLSVTNFKETVKCVQIWHAVGAFKKFGLEDASNTIRKNTALERFQNVYDCYDNIVVGSDKMADIFMKAFNLPDDRFIYSGVPRTDFFFDSYQIEMAKVEFIQDFPIVNNKKVLLYAPTYRDNELKQDKLHINLNKLYHSFKHEYVLLLRLHPAVSSNFENKYPGFVFNVTEYPNINHLLVGADILITDYSSIPFEYALLGKPIIFYLYDFEEYQKNRGLFINDLNDYPGLIAKTTDDIVHYIKSKEFKLEHVHSFAKEWNLYSKGNSSINLIFALYDSKFIIKQTKEREYA